MSDFIDADDDWLETVNINEDRKIKKKNESKQSEEYAVIWCPVFCPRCGSSKNKIYSSHPKDNTRYHKCMNCTLNFKSIALVPEWVREKRKNFLS